MTKNKRNAALFAASAAVLSLAVPLTTASASTAGHARPSHLVWTKCQGTDLDPRQECATIDVPMDYADPHGKKISLAFSRIPAENPKTRRGALFMIPGGPGGGSLDDPSGKGQKLPQEVRNTYDLIGFDPRGYGRSTPVSCDLERGDLARARLFPWPAPDGSVTETMATARRMSDACARNGGRLMRHISTANEARDLDRIRAALGERKISAWAVSYGTYVGAVYNELFPHRTDRFVLDSNDNPDPVRVERAWLAAFEVGAEDNFPEFAKWASRRGNPDRVAGTAAEVRRLFLRLAARLDREPLPWPGADPQELNGNVLRQVMLESLYDPDDYPALARLMLAAQKGTMPPAPQAPPEPVVQNVTAVSAATFCNDAAWPRSAAWYEKGVPESRAKFPLTAGMPRNAVVCAVWPYTPQEPAVRITDRGPSTVLMVQNRRDAASPLTGALKLREALGRRAVMVTVNSTGHEAYLANGNACGDQVVSDFLATGKRPTRDILCG
ncbi:alpha/beta hydrolase family protein [Streptomyces puniciscabiei]|uniref:Alpha/beta hydrolase family protein n=1 Tax=Streptomyces puniciscabiei TaxID=164348 RepID=A0A542TH85_9ACTN|nr:alpha/beta hydrolase [Streptomyces puniciscabiei]TQK86205.1 alpha/beta hydrolase family protein [Streptomyces puniciscabiei]